MGHSDALGRPLSPRLAGGSPHDWDATTYDRVSGPQLRWGGPVVARLPLAGDELVLDAGCGTGRVTEALLERLPRGRVIGLDGSTRMLDEARHRLGRQLGPPVGRVALLAADLRRPLPIASATLNAVVSTATFHWIPDHDALFHNLAAVLRPGGRLEAQCGGRGNIASVEEALAHLRVPAYPWTYATPQETTRRLEQAGFTEVESWLTDERTPFASRAELERFLATVVLWPQLVAMEPSEHAAFVSRVVDGLPALELDYVRLNLRGRLREGPRPGPRRIPGAESTSSAPARRRGPRLSTAPHRTPPGTPPGPGLGLR